jgi:hypothetical protein
MVSVTIDKGQKMGHFCKIKKTDNSEAFKRGWQCHGSGG